MFLTEALEQSITQAIATLGLSFWGMQFIVQRQLLRVYIDKETGITVDDCALASKHISVLLDNDNPNSASYTLEVSSPGLDRPLLCQDHWHVSIGEVLQVELLAPVDGKRKLKGTLVSMKDGCAALENNQIVSWVPLNQVKRANVVPDFG